MFLPTLTIKPADLTDPKICGRLTPGQWIQLPHGGPKGRFVGLTPHGTVRIYWPETTRGVFPQMRARFRKQYGMRAKTLFSVNVATTVAEFI